MSTIKDMDNVNNDILEINNNFYIKYNPQISKIVTKILNNAGQACDIEDCVNIVFLELMERLQQYNEARGSMAAFVAVVARSVALNYCKKNTRKTGELIGGEMIEFMSEPIEIENKIEFELLVESILKKLNEQENVLFTFRFVLFYSPEEIAKIFNIRRNTVDVRINRLKSKIKKLLIKGGITI